MSTRPLNGRSAIFTIDGSWLPIKHLHIDIQYQPAQPAQSEPANVIESTAKVLPLAEESSEETTSHGHRSARTALVRR